MSKYGSIQTSTTSYKTLEEKEDDDFLLKVGKKTKEDNANILSLLSFWWCNSIVTLGYKRPLEHYDLPSVSESDDVAQLSKKLEENWEIEMRSPQPSFVRALRKTFGRRFFLAGIPKFFSDALGFVGPFLMQQIIIWLESDDPMYVGYLYALGLFLAPFLQSIIQNHYFYQTFRTGMNVRAAVVSLLYRKSLKLTTSSRQKKTLGEIVNLQSNDTQRLMDLCPNFHLLWSAPLQIIAALTLLVITIGYSAFVGLGIMILLVPIQGVIAAKLGKLRKNLLFKTDLRIKYMNEVLQGIRVIKFYAWETNFSDKINQVRKEEVKILRSQAYWRAFIGFFLIVSPVIVSMATFVVYSITEGALTPEIIFPALAYFNLLRFPLTFMPVLIIALVEAKISINRLWEFLISPEYQEITNQRIGETGLKIIDGTFTWDLNKTGNPALKNVTMEAKEGELVMVVGPVGSGKSSLIAAFLGGIEKISGEVSVSGKISYAAQQAWITNQTVKDNILFGNPYNEERYKSAIHAACLKQDLAMFPGGDMTEIGEKGINLSGGQKQRISLARAVYADSDIIILDDVLSAVDSHVGKHIFEECIMGALKTKTRLFVTHQNQFLPFADRIIILKDGEIVNQGSYEELVEKGIDFASLTSKKGQPAAEESSEESEDEEKPEDAALIPKSKLSRKLTRHSSISEEKGPKDKSSKLMEAEERETGVVSGKIYWLYLMAGGGTLMIFMLIFSYVIGEIVRVSSDLWLALWSTPADERSFKFDPPPFGGDTENFFMYIYILFSLVYSGFTLFRNIVTSILGVNASKKLHEDLFLNIMKAPISFFDVTPVGRILNRFTKDLDNIDNLLPQTLNQFLGTFFICLSTLILIAYVTPWFLLALVPIMGIYFFVMQYYRRTSRELQRLDSISRSPIYSYFSETLTGIDTIRAFKLDQRFSDENEYRINYNQRAYWMVQVTNRWLSLRLEILGTFITFASAIFAVVAKDTISPSLAGLSITYSLQVTGFLNWVVRMATQGEAQMNAVERIRFYSEIENEAPWEKDIKPPPNWPTNASIVFKNVYMRYRPGLDPVLKDISLEILSGEKIGIVGRTGAGKSSMMLILFRIIEIYQGQILIDGIDISTIGLHDLRSEIAIIPQDPVLFNDTIRKNVDPFEDYQDDEIWRALEQVYLKSLIEMNPQGLMAMVSENGSNWSLGQRQLFCFARALLKKTKILVMDEATSSVDMETDALIQKTIRTQFADRTVLTIAHRLSTIMDSDRVIVMDQGRVVEFDSPSNLLQVDQGVFLSMVNNTGSKSSQLLKKIAHHQMDIFGNEL